MIFRKTQMYLFWPSFFSSRVFSASCLTTSLIWMEMNQVGFLRWHHLHWILKMRKEVCIIFQTTIHLDFQVSFSYWMSFINFSRKGICKQNPLLFLFKISTSRSNCAFFRSRLGNLLHIPCCLATVVNVGACVLLTWLRLYAFWLTHPTTHT